jgi:hypothetical protein
MFVTLAQSPTVTDIVSIFDKLGTPGLLIGAVYYITREVKNLYDGRIKALEAASIECEKDRINLRQLIISKLSNSEHES